MTVEEAVKELQLTVVAGQDNMNREITGGYVSDLLSNVMGQAQSGNLWITMQGHQNVAAVALLVGLTAVVIAGGAQPDGATLAKAETENIVIATTPLSAYEVAGRLYQLGLRGV